MLTRLTDFVGIGSLIMCCILLFSIASYWGFVLILCITVWVSYIVGKKHVVMDLAELCVRHKDNEQR